VNLWGYGHAAPNGAGFSPEKVSATLLILSVLFPHSCGKEKQEIEIRWILRGLCPKRVYIK